MRKLAACLFVVTALTACDGLPVERKWIVEELESVADAPKHKPDSEVLRIEGVPRADLAGMRIWKVSGSRHGLVSPETAPVTSWPVKTKPKLRMKQED